MITAYSRGHKIIYNINDKITYTSNWVYVDTKEIYDDSRPCKKCGKYPTKEGYDACLGFIKDTNHACCGHGISVPYAQAGVIE